MGMGFYGEVWEAERDGQLFAVKKYHKTSLTPSELESKFLALVDRGLQHRNVMEYFGVGYIDLEDTYHFVVAMERADQNLASFMEVHKGQLVPEGKQLILTSVADGLAYLHSKHIIHRGLKPSNVLMTREGNLAISDYGNTLVRPILDVSADCRQENAVFRNYLPPEASEPEETHRESFDVFSFGHLSLYVILEEQPHPLKAPTFTENRKKKARSEVERRDKYFYKMICEVEGTVLEPLTEWTEKCLHDDEERRPHISDFKNLIRK